MFKVLKSGKRAKKSWKRMITKVTFVGPGFTRKPPKYERFIRPTGEAGGACGTGQQHAGLLQGMLSGAQSVRSGGCRLHRAWVFVGVCGHGRGGVCCLVLCKQQQ